MSNSTKTPTEKALELMDKVSEKMPSVKNVALICALEARAAVPMYTGNLNPTWKYWDDVRKELEKL